MNSGNSPGSTRPPFHLSEGTVSDLLPNPCWEGDATGRCTFVNRVWLARTGLGAMPDLPSGWRECIHPEDREATRLTLETACRSGKGFELEYRLRHADGSYRWVSDQGHPMVGPGGEVQRYLACLFDVHQRRTAEMRCLRLGQLYQALGRVNRAVAQRLGPIAFFEEACRMAVEVGKFRLAWVGLMDPQTRRISPVAAAGALPQLKSGQLLAQLQEKAVDSSPEADPSRSIVGRACLERHFFLCDDLQGDESQAPWSSLAREHDLRASAAFPFLVREQVRGVLVLYSEDSDSFDSEMVDLLDRVAEKLGLSLERSDQATRRREIEGRLRVSERLFAATLDTMNAAIAVLDESGRILAVNAAWSEFQDVTNPLVHGQALGSDYREVCSQFTEQPGILAAPASGSLEVMNGAREVFVTEYKCLDHTLSRWYATTISRFSNEGFERVVLAHRDITNRKLAEERLRESENLFRLITENAADLIALMNGEGQRVYCSPSYFSLLGYTADELIPHRPIAIIHAEDRDRVSATLRAVMEGDLESATMELRLIRKDGTSGLFESRMVAIRDAGEKASTGLLVISRDISEREAAEQERQRMEVELRHAQKLESIGQLAAGIAHEINTPTQFIGDNLRFMRDGITDLFTALDTLLPALVTADGESAELHGLLRAALDKADFGYLREELPKAAVQSLEGVTRVSKIVGAMKEFSHPGGEEKTLADLNRAIESTVTVSRNEWKYVAELNLDLDPGLPLVPCLPSEINQVVLNLVVNASHAIADTVGNSGKKGRISVCTRHEGGEAVIQVEDSGSGIPEAIRGRIFDPFFTTKEVGRGSGQGLAIAHAVVVEKHGGTIGFETSEGVGTIFTIRLPLVPGPLKKVRT